MIKQPLLNYKTNENRLNLVNEVGDISYYNPCSDIRYADKRAIGMQTVKSPNLHRVSANGNSGIIVQRISHYDYVVNDVLITQCVGCSFEYLEALTEYNVKHGDYQKQYEVKKSIIEMQIEQGVNA